VVVVVILLIRLLNIVLNSSKETNQRQALKGHHDV